MIAALPASEVTQQRCAKAITILDSRKQRHESNLDLADLVNRLYKDNKPDAATIRMAVKHYVDQMLENATSLWLTCTR